MVAISATNSATPSQQQALGQSRLVQARREADQAEAKAKDLRQQAQRAESQAQKSQGNVREQAARNQQLSATDEAQLKSKPAEAPAQAQDALLSVYDASSVLSSQSQATGRIVNLSA